MKLKQAKISVEQPDGTVKRVSIYYKNAAELAAKTAEIERKKEAAFDASKAKTLFENVADAWQEEYFKTIKPGTQQCYLPAINRAKEALGDTQIDEITPKAIQRLYERMEARGYSAQTIHVERVVIGLIFRYACLEYGLSNNPNRETTARGKGKKAITTHVPSGKDLFIVAGNPDLPFGLFPFFLLYTGLRRGEALALQWKDVDLNNDVIHITKALAFNSNRPYIKTTKTESGIRNIGILPPLKFVLQEQKKKDSDYLFHPVDKPSEMITETSFRRQWERYCKLSGFSGTTKQLRHMFATLCFELEVSEKDCQYIMGHSSIEITKNIYTHIREERRQVVTDKLKNYVWQE